MPRQLSEIKNFNVGTLLNASERDIPDNASAYSLNINPLSENGILDSIRNDRLAFTTDDSMLDILFPVSHPGDNSGDINEDYPFFKSFRATDTYCYLTYIGTQGRRETVVASNFKPWFEKVHVTDSINLSIYLKSALTVNTEVLDYYTNGESITKNNLADSDITTVGFTNGEATITILDPARANYDASNDNYFTLTTPDGLVKSYIFDNSTAIANTGNDDGSGKVLIGMSDVDISGDDTSDKTNIATQVKNAIENTTNGHGNRITVSQSANVLTLTQLSNELPLYLSVGTYFELQTTEAAYSQGEIIKCLEIDRNNKQIKIKRGCFGKKRATYTASTQKYFVIASKLSYENGHQVHFEGIEMNLSGFSKYSGNHIGGNAHYLKKANLAAGEDSWAGNIDRVGAFDITRANTTITFNASDKTVAFGSEINLSAAFGWHFFEGDYITFYSSYDKESSKFLNNGFQAKILKLDASTRTITLDTAPVDETMNSDTPTEMISNEADRTFDAVSQNWVVWAEAGSVNFSHNYPSNRLLIYGDSNTAEQGAQLADAYLETIEANTLYKITARMDGDNSGANFYMKFGGVETDEFSITTSEVDYIFYIQTGSSISEQTLKIYNKANDFTASNDRWYIHNVTVKKEPLVFMEANLIKNHTLSHSVNTATQTVASNQIYKINDWKTYEDKDTTAGLIWNERTETTSTNVSLEFSGGYWETAPDLRGYSASSAQQRSFYPFRNTDRFIKIVSQFENIGATTSGTTAIGDEVIYTSSDIAGFLAAGDLIKISSEYMKILEVYNFHIKVQRNFPLFSEHSTQAAISNGTAIAKCINPGIRQDISKDRLKPGQEYLLSFYAQDNEASSGAQDEDKAFGAISLRINGGYFDIGGDLVYPEEEFKQGFSDIVTDILMEQRWMFFQDLPELSNQPVSIDSAGTPTVNGLDNIWRRFDFKFKIPDKIEILTDLELEIASRGIDNSYIYIDQFSLLENTKIFINSKSPAMTDSTVIDSGGTQDLVFYDSSTSFLKTIPNIFETKEVSQNEIPKSPYSTSKIDASSVSFINNNRETHVGFGSKVHNTNPQWVGYLNHKVFGVNHSGDFYQDEDTVHKYGMDGAANLSKIAVAGEHEYLKAYWNNSGGSLPVSSGLTTAFPDNTLRIYHTNHNMNVGDNIVVRQWADASNEWDGQGVWVITRVDSAFFDCMRHNTYDLDPAEEGVIATSSTAYSAPNTTVTCDANHNLATGDNVYIYGATNDTDANGTHSVTVTGNTTYTINDTDLADIGNDTGVVTVKEFRLCYRPYYFYGIKDGEPYLYRITPSAKIDDDGSAGVASDLNTTYIAGTVERCLELPAKMCTIATCHSKGDEGGTGGGHVYVASNITNKLYKLNVEIKYDEWKTSFLGFSTIIPEFKSYIWSNDNTNGNVGGTAGHQFGLVEEFSPTIDTDGVISDILETKGPVSTFVHSATSRNENNTTDFDTRLWIQFKQSGGDTFGEGSRFLFCGKTEKDNTTGEDTIYFADRTPPMTALMTKYLNFGGWITDALVGWGTNAGYDDAGTTELKQYWYHWFWIWGYDRGNRELEYISTRWNENYNDYHDMRITFTSWKSLNMRGSPGSGIFSPPKGKQYFQFGYNVGWKCGRYPNVNLPSVRLIKYGLFQLADNDKDGIIDGTGVIVPSTTSLPSGNNKPYGNLHQKITSHVVGVVGSSENEWMREGGKVCNVDDTSTDYNFRGVGQHEPLVSNERTQDAPGYVNMEKCIFICSDMHYGDYSLDPWYTYTAAQSYTHNGQAITRVTLEAEKAKDFQAGDCLVIKSADVSSGEFAGHGGTISESTYVVMVDETNNYLYLSCSPSGMSSGDEVQGTLFANTNKRAHTHSSKGTVTWPYLDNVGYDGVASESYSYYHFAYSKSEPLNGDVFTKKNANTAPGHFTRTWYTPPYLLGGAQAYMPGLLGKNEKLSYRGGFMIRPFDMTNEDFNDLMIGNTTAVDCTLAPDNIYHKKNSSKLHDSIGTTNHHNSLATKIFISSPLKDPDDYNKSKIYICDLNTFWPDLSTEVQSVHYTDSSFTSSDSDYIRPWDALIIGTVKNGSADYIASSDGTYRNATQNPVFLIEDPQTYVTHGLEFFTTDFRNTTGVYESHAFNYYNKNSLSGLCFSIKNANGTIETRQIVGDFTKSSSTTVSNDETHAIELHWPLSYTPAAGDVWWIWRPSNVCTSPVRLMKTHEVLANPEIGTVYNSDARLDTNMYKGEGVTTGTKLVSNGTTATFTCLENHFLNTGDIIEVYNCENEPRYNGTYSITVTAPKVFTFTTQTADITDNIDGNWRLISFNPTTNSNPVKLEIAKPIYKSMFGGLDARKLLSRAVTGVADNTDDITLTTSTNHLFDVGDTVTFESSDNDQDGTYIVTADNGTTTLDVTNTDSTSATGTLYTDQWELFFAERGSKSRLGKLRAGWNAWDRGNKLYNAFRYDRSSVEEETVFLNIAESDIDLRTNSVANQTGDYFKADTNYDYKISLIYDGYQEGPLSDSTWTWSDSVSRDKIQITIRIERHSKRLTAVCLYRRDAAHDYYKLVEQITTSSGWNREVEKWVRQIEDDGLVGASYEARTGINEVISTIGLKYGISTDIDGYLFAGDCSHELIENAENMVFRSKSGMFSIFDWVNDFLTLRSKPTALTSFQGRLYAFDRNNIYRINQESLVIEDIFEGVGCLNKDSVIVTEYGMFFADANGAYMHNGSSPVKISQAIQQGGNTDTSFGGTDNIRDVSWSNVVSKDTNMKVLFDSISNSVLFSVEYKDYRDAYGDTSSFRYKSRQYLWAYNITGTRWDLWELSEDSNVGTFYTGKSGEIYVSINNGVYEFMGGSGKRDYTWISKKLTMNEDSIVKVYNKVKLNGISSNLNLEGDFKESSSRFLLVTNTGALSTSNDMTHSDLSGKHSEYKLSGSNKKGNWLQFKLEDMTEPIDSIGVLFRRKSTK